MAGTLSFLDCCISAKNFRISKDNYSSILLPLICCCQLLFQCLFYHSIISLQKEICDVCGLFLAAIFTAALLRVPLATFLSEHFFAPGKQPPGFFELFFNSVIKYIYLDDLFGGRQINYYRIRFQKYINAIENEKIKNELDFLKV